MRRMAQLLASRVSALSAAAMRPSAMVLGRPAAPAPVLAQRASLRTLAPFLGAPVRPHAPGLSQIRTMTEEASPVLADVLREEVKYEQENYKQPEVRSSAFVQWQRTSPKLDVLAAHSGAGTIVCKSASAAPSDAASY